MRIGRWLFGREVNHSAIILGNDASGKTMMLYQWRLGEEVTTIPTIGFNVETIDLPKGIKFTLWDVGGCDQIRPLTRHYMQNRLFIFFVHSCTDNERLDESIQYLHQLIGWMDEFCCPNLLILLNKQDLLPPAERETIVSGLRQRFEAEIAQYGDKHTIKVMDTPGLSGRTGAQLDVIMDEVVTVIQGDKKKKPTPSTAPPKNPELEKGPSDEELRERIKKANATSDSPDEFWKSFLSGDLEAWDHHTHLRAGFFVIHDCFARGRNIFECADEFIAHLTRLREKKPDRFRNTAHRTMTIFWLVQLQVAALAYQLDNKMDEFPPLGAFADIALFKPHLMNSGLWRAYYSKDLMFSPPAREDWHLPDLQPLPTITSEPSAAPKQSRAASESDPDRLLRFAFRVIQTTLTTKVRRGAVVKQAFDSLQSSTIRLRARDPSIPPYSETQAYFWIQFTHAALRSFELDPTQSTDTPKFEGSVANLAFPAFKALFGITGNEWQEHYTPSTWDAVSSRMSFVNPDKKPLPNVLAIPSQENIKLARTRMVNAVNYRLTASVELPPAAELSFLAGVLLDEGKLMSPASLNVATRAGLLLFIHQRLFAARDPSTVSHKISRRAAETAMELGKDVGTTQSMFWVQQVLVCTSDNTEHVDFERLVRGNPHLAYENLPYMYYSPETWHSGEAKEIFMPPDRHSHPSIVSRKQVW